MIMTVIQRMMLAVEFMMWRRQVAILFRVCEEQFLKILLSPSHSCITWLKCVRSTQLLLEDALADQQIGAQKVTDGHEPTGTPLESTGIGINNYLI